MWKAGIDQCTVRGSLPGSGDEIKALLIVSVTVLYAVCSQVLDLCPRPPQTLHRCSLFLREVAEEDSPRHA